MTKISPTLLWRIRTKLPSPCCMQQKLLIVTGLSNIDTCVGGHKAGYWRRGETF